MIIPGNVDRLFKLDIFLIFRHLIKNSIYETNVWRGKEEKLADFRIVGCLYFKTV